MLLMSGMAFGQQTASITVNIDGTPYTVVASSEMSNALTGYTQGQLDLAHTGVYDVFESEGWSESTRPLGIGTGWGYMGYWVQNSYRAYDLYHPDGTITGFEYSPAEANCQAGYVSHQARQREIIRMVNNLLTPSS